MRPDVRSLMDFYASPLGQSACHAVTQRIGSLWTSVSGLDVLGIGYAPPYLDALRGKARRFIAAMPGDMGAHEWCPGPRGSAVTICGDHELPFPDALFDRVVIVHSMEETHRHAHFLREVWRICAPEARVIIIAANRTGLWSRMETTPFGHGRPFSRRQLADQMRDALLIPTAWTHAVYQPPFDLPFLNRAADAWEKVGRTLWPKLGGVVLVEGVKRTRIDPTRPERVRIVPSGARPVGAQPALSLTHEHVTHIA